MVYQWNYMYISFNIITDYSYETLIKNILFKRKQNNSVGFDLGAWIQ